MKIKTTIICLFLLLPTLSFARKFLANISSYDGRVYLAQNLYIDISDIDPDIKILNLEDYSIRNRLQLINDDVVINIPKEGTSFFLGEVDYFFELPKAKVYSSDEIQVEIISKKISRKFTWGAGCGITGCVIKPHFKKKIKYQVEIKNKFGDIICFNHNYLESKDKFYLGRCQH
jgi:hypothetical protein